MQFLQSHNQANASDADLVERYWSTGDLNTLGSLYGRYMDLIYGVCLKIYRDEELAKDSVLQIFEELIGKLKKYEVTNFRPWLYQLARNHCIRQ